MVEITHGGTWFKWSSMNRQDRAWFVLSTVAAIPSGVVIGVVASGWSYRLGYRASAGRDGPDRLAPLVESDAFRYGALAATVLLAISFVAWWYFSRRQDELFNRIQNYALGRAGGWTMVVAACWWILSLGQWVEPLPLGGVVLIGWTLVLAFWFRGVRLCT